MKPTRDYAAMGRKGGAKTKQLYGIEHYSDIGKMNRGKKHKKKQPSTTQERLIAALEHAGAHPTLIDNAKKGMYDNLRSELAMPLSRLVEDLKSGGLPGLAVRALRGEFYPSKAEMRAWYASDEGKSLMKETGLES